jgi:group I intron endonuclease
MTSAIYKIQSIIKPDKIYIGSAVQIKRRWHKHLCELKYNKHNNPKLQRHYNKYGSADLVFIIIEPCFPEFLFIREQYYIDTLNPWFNIVKNIGTNSRIVSKETKDKLSIINLGRKKSDETRKKLSIAHKGKRLTDEHKRNLSISGKDKHGNYKFTKEQTLKRIETRRKLGHFTSWNKGRKGVYSKETLEKMRASAKKRGISKEVMAKMIAGHLKYFEQKKAS